MEIQKLVAFLGDRQQITTKDVDLLVASTREEPLYELTSALGLKKPLDALRILNRLWEQGLHPLAMVSGLTNAYRRFILAREVLDNLPSPAPESWKGYPDFIQTILPRLRDNRLSGPLIKLHPFALFNLLEATRHFHRKELILALETLHHIDLKLKTTGADARFLLEDFILRQCRLSCRERSGPAS